MHTRTRVTPCRTARAAERRAVYARPGLQPASSTRPAIRPTLPSLTGATITPPGRHSRAPWQSWKADPSSALLPVWQPLPPFLGRSCAREISWRCRATRTSPRASWPAIISPRWACRCAWRPPQTTPSSDAARGTPAFHRDTQQPRSGCVRYRPVVRGSPPPGRTGGGRQHHAHHARAKSPGAGGRFLAGGRYQSPGRSFRPAARARGSARSGAGRKAPVVAQAHRCHPGTDGSVAGAPLTAHTWPCAWSGHAKMPCRLPAFLAGRADVRRVRYPGLAERSIARHRHAPDAILRSDRQLHPARPPAERRLFLNSCKLVYEATSYGSVHTSAERRARWGGDAVPEGFIRLSAGIEDAGDLLADLSQALDRLLQLDWSRRGIFNAKKPADSAAHGIINAFLCIFTIHLILILI